MKRTNVVGMAALFFLMGGCRENHPPGTGLPGTGGAPGDGPTGRQDAGSGGSRPGDGPAAEAGSASASTYAACVAYVRAQCNRRGVCDGGGSSADPCPSVTDLCPDLLFSPGSLRTVEGTFACARAWDEMPCPDVLANKAPACVIAGSLPFGASCISSSQCASTACSGGLGTCGTCIMRAPPGGACGGSVLCAYGEDCVSGRCVAPPPTGLMLGQACMRFGDCLYPNYCLPGPGGEKTCQPLPALGQPCQGTSFCSGGVCTQAKICEPFPTAGSPCKRDANNNFWLCDAASFCDQAVSPPTCKPRTPPGSACRALASGQTEASCASGSQCICVDAACSAGRCSGRRQEGDPCADATDPCVPGTECRAGTCVAVASQGLMAKACTPKLLDAGADGAPRSDGAPGQ
jgi:hypothetical protein